MMYYDRIDVSESIDVFNSIVSKQCVICPYRYFLDKGFKFQSSAYNCCQNVLMISIDHSSIVILTIHCVDYRCIINGISKSEAIDLLEYSDLSKRSRSLQNMTVPCCV